MPSACPSLRYAAVAAVVLTCLAAPYSASAQYYGSTPVDTSWIAAARKTPVQLRFTTMDGKQMDLAKLRGKVIALEFWALNDCVDCTQKTIQVKRAYDKYHAKGFHVIRVVMDTLLSDSAAIRLTAVEGGVTWPIQFDGKGKANEIVAKYKVQGMHRYGSGGYTVYYPGNSNSGLPILLFDRKGLLVEANVGAEDLEAYVGDLVSKP